MSTAIMIVSGSPAPALESVRTDGANARSEWLAEQGGVADYDLLKICRHARSSESVKICVRYGIQIIYHASFADEEALDMLEDITILQDRSRIQAIMKDGVFHKEPAPARMGAAC